MRAVPQSVVQSHIIQRLYRPRSNFRQDTRVGLFQELDHPPDFSPATSDEAIYTVGEKFIGSLALLSGMTFQGNQEFDDVMSSRPAQIVRRQHTSSQFANSAESAGLRLQHIVYYHLHPYPARYQKLLTDLYNRLSLAMQPLGTLQLLHRSVHLS